MGGNLEDQMKKHGLTLVELIVVIVLVVVLVLLVMPRLHHDPNLARRASCANNLRQMAIVLKMYANESKDGFWPPLQTGPCPDVTSGDPKKDLYWFAAGPRVRSIYPEYMTDATILVCPEDSDFNQSVLDNGALCKSYDSTGKPIEGPALIGSCYSYFGWVFDKPEPAATLPEIVSGVDPATKTLFMERVGHLASASVPVQMTRCMANFVGQFLGGDLDAASKDYGVEGEGAGKNTKAIYHLKEGVERFWITDVSNPASAEKAASEIWVMMDRFSVEQSGAVFMFNHVPGGSNVLYMDGHVEFVRYPSKPPLARPFGEMLPIIDALSGRKPAS